jgi:outer membrane receptor protein involved in Fe transport
LLLLFAAAVGAEATPPQAAPADQTLSAVVVEGRAPIIGDLQKGVLNFTPQYFVKVRPSTAMDMVQWLPGFNFQDTRDLRGLDGAGGNVLIDGKPPASKTDTLQSVLRRIPSEQVERVDLIAGGAPGIDMRGWPVIANVILKKNPKPRLTYSLGSHLDIHGRITPQFSINTARRSGDRALEVSVDFGRNIGIYPIFGYGPTVRTDGAGAPVYVADTHVNSGGPYVIASGTYERGLAGGKLKLNASARDFGSTFIQVDALRSGPSYGYTHVQTYHQGELGLTYEHALGKRTTLETQALERITRFDATNILTRPPAPSRLIKSDHADESVARATIRFRRSEKLTLSASAEAAINTDKTDGAATLNGVPVALPGAIVDVRERRGETGATLSWKPSPQVSLESALKLETSTLTGRSDVRVDRSFTYLKPRTVFTWAPDKNDQLRLRVEHEVGQVGFNAFAASSNFVTGQVFVGNTNLKPQRAWAAEAVYDRKFWNGGDLTLTLRHRRLVDVFGYVAIATSAGVLGGYANVGGGRQTDAVVNLLVPLKRLGIEGATVRGAATWTRSRVTDPFTGLPRRLSGQSGFVGELHLVEDLPRQKLNFGLDAYYVGPNQIYEPAGNQNTGAWARFNLFVEYRLKPSLNLRAEVNNLPGTGVHQVIDSFTGLRGSSPLLYRDDKRLAVGPVFFARVRRTFQ